MEKVSCLCPTFARFPTHGHLLGECVESFLRQDYTHKELIILNDCPEQELVCNAPGVRVVNLRHRCPTLGDKYNLAVTLASGDVLLPWEDDDISLPSRISQAVEKLGERGYWNPQASWFLDSRGLHKDHSHGVCHNASTFRRIAWAVAGGYPSVSGNQDAVMDGRLGRYSAQRRPLPCDQWQYVYRWGVSDCHVSGSADHERFYAEWGTRSVERGRFVIEPRWEQDYTELCRAKALA